MSEAKEFTPFEHDGYPVFDQFDAVCAGSEAMRLFCKAGGRFTDEVNEQMGIEPIGMLVMRFGFADPEIVTTFVALGGAFTDARAHDGENVDDLVNRSLQGDLKKRHEAIENLFEQQKLPLRSLFKATAWALGKAGLQAQLFDYAHHRLGQKPEHPAQLDIYAKTLAATRAYREAVARQGGLRHVEEPSLAMARMVLSDPADEYAAARQGAEALRTFIAEGGALTSRPDKEGATSAHYAIWSKKPYDAFRAYCELGGPITDYADPYYKRTVAMLAASFGVEGIQLLRLRLNDPFTDQRTRDGHTAAYYARMHLRSFKAILAYYKAVAEQGGLRKFVENPRRAPSKIRRRVSLVPRV